MSIKERCTQANWSVSCGPPRCQHQTFGKNLHQEKNIKMAKKGFKNVKNSKKYKDAKKEIIIK